MLKPMLFKSDESGTSWLALDENAREYNDMTITEDGKIYTLYKDRNKSYKGIVVKYSSSGEIEWSKVYTEKNNTKPILKAITHLSNDNIVITGNQDDCIKFIKIDHNGTIISTNSTIASLGGLSSNQVTRPFMDYIYSCVRSHDESIILIKQDLSGITKWIQTLKQPSSEDTHTYGESVTIDADQNIYVCGYTGSGNTINWDLLIAKFDSSGNIKWKNIYHNSYDPNGSADYGYDIITSPNGSIYICGTTNIQSTVSESWSYPNILLAKCSNNGNIEWCKTIGITNQKYETGKHVRVASDETIYVCGETATSGASYDGILIAKYSSSGDIQSQKHIDCGFNNNIMQVNSFEIYHDEDIYVCGYANITDIYKGFVLKISKDTFEKSEDVKIGPFTISEGNFSTDKTAVLSERTSNLYVSAPTFTMDSLNMSSTINTSQNITIYKE